MNCNCIYEYDSKFYSRSDMYLILYPKEGKYKIYEDDECKKEVNINEFMRSKMSKFHLVVKD